MNEIYDDDLVAHYVTVFLEIMRDCPMAKTKINVCYNLTARILRLFCICGDKEDVVRLIDEFHKGLKESIEELYEQ